MWISLPHPRPRPHTKPKPNPNPNPSGTKLKKNPKGTGAGEGEEKPERPPAKRQTIKKQASAAGGAHKDDIREGDEGMFGPEDIKHHAPPTRTFNHCRELDLSSIAHGCIVLRFEGGEGARERERNQDEF